MMDEQHIGQRFGSYRLTRFLGSGGFASVYVGEHVYLRSLAALKVLHMHIAVNDEPMFLQEARTLAGLDHPHIIRIRDYGIHEKIPFLVMDYAPNGTIRQQYPKNSIIPLANILGYVRHITSALEYAHHRNVVHCDLKPENILLGSEGQALLADFGTSFIFEPRKTQQNILGTVAYMAPEQLRGKTEFASDQYALAVMIYEWLTGELPFSGKTFTEIALKHLYERPVPLSQRTPVAFPEIEQIVMIALSKDPRDRFRSIKAFAIAFEHACKQISKEYATLSPSRQLLTGNIEREQIDENIATAIRLLPKPMVQPDQATDPVREPFSGKITERPKRRIGRRTLLIGATLGLVAGLTGGGVAAYMLLRPKEQAEVVYSGHKAPVYVVAWSPDGRYLASGGFDKTAQVWDPTTAQNYSVYRRHAGSVNALSWLPNDGSKIVTGSSDRTVQIWNAMKATEEILYERHTDNVRGVSWSPNELYIASCGDDATAQIWSVSTDEPIQIYTQHEGRVWTVCWSPDSQHVATGGVDSTVRVWEAQTGNTTFIYRGHHLAVKTTAWSPDGTLVASASDDETVHVWNFVDGNVIAVYKGHTNLLFTLAWSPDGKYIASGGDDATVHVWNSKTAELVYKYSGHSLTIQNISWSPNGKHIASASGDQTVHVWSAPV